MSEKLPISSVESNKINLKKNFKKISALAATAALGVGVMAGCSSEAKEPVAAAPVETQQPQTVVEAPQSEKIIEEEIIEEEIIEEEVIEDEIEYEPFYSEAIINYDLTEGWEDLNEQGRVFRAVDFFKDNGISPIGYVEFKELEESQALGQAVLDNFMERYELVHGVMSDVSDPRNQDFALKMSEAGLFDERLGDGEEFDTYSDFMDVMFYTGVDAGQRNTPVEYTLGDVISYSEKYVAGNGWEAMRINSRGFSNLLMVSDPPEAFFQSMWYLPVVPYDGDGALGTFPMLVGIVEDFNRIDLPLNYNSWTDDEVAVVTPVK